MKDSKIQWTHHTFNPWWGCTRVSPGCVHCYAETFAKRTGHGWGPQADRRLFGDKHWNEPVKWNRYAEKAGERRRVFCASMADVFEDRPELEEQRARLWGLIEATPMLDWLLLTKRPENLERMLPAAWLESPRQNVWLGTTAEDQQYADLRIPLLLRTPAAVRFVSYEPALERVDFVPWLFVPGPHGAPTDLIPRNRATFDPALDWIIVGGESGPGARPFDIAWARSTVEQCKAAGVACFVKQMGGFTISAKTADWVGHRGDVEPTGNGCESRWRIRYEDKKGGEIAEWPEDIRVREFPR